MVEIHYKDEEFERAWLENYSLGQEEIDTLVARTDILNQEEMMRGGGFDLNLLLDRESLYRHIFITHRSVSKRVQQWGVTTDAKINPHPLIAWFYAHIYHDERRIEFSSVTTLRLFRRKGLQSLLFKAIIAYYPGFSFSLAVEDKSVIPFYEKIGFHLDNPDSLQKNIENEDPILMSHSP